MNEERPAPSASRRRRFAGYEIVDELGVHMGTHRYKAMQLTLHRPVVLHVLPAEAAAKRDSMPAAMFERQMNVCATLHHENVVGAIEAGEFEGDRYFVTEHVEGSTLHDAIAANPPWDVKPALGVARDVARALVHLEGLRMVHREITPRTIALSEHGDARLIDFRRAKFLVPEGSETWYDESIQLALYTSPESTRGEKALDIRADIYSLGCVLYHLLTGRPPFYGKNVAVVLDWQRKRKARDPRWLRPELPRGVVDLLDRCLRKNREERYPTAAALCADVEGLLAGRAPARSATTGAAWERPFDG